MSNPTSNFGWQMPTPTDLVTDLPADFEVFGQAVDSTMADLKGGTTGQILSKNSNTDMDFIWIANDQGDITGVTATSPLTGGGTSGAITVGIQAATTLQSGAVQLENSTSSTSTTTAAVPASVKSAYDLAAAAIPKSTVTTAGDLIVATGSSTVSRLGIGTNGQVLSSNGTTATWTTPTSGMTNPMTTTGDTIYSSSGSTPARLGIGSSGQVMTVSGGIPSWQTPTSGGMTLISSTSLSGTSTTISSIPSGYNELKLYILNARPDANNVLWIRFNSDSGTNYATAIGSSGSVNYSGTFGNLSSNQLAASTGTGQIVVSIPNYTNTSVWKMANTFNNYPYFSDTATASFFQQNVSWKSTSAITSITIGWQTASTVSGTLNLYGVK